MRFFFSLPIHIFKNRENSCSKIGYYNLIHFIAITSMALSVLLVAQPCSALCYPMDLPARLLCPRDSSGKNPGVSRLSLLQRIFLVQESNPGLLRSRQILYPFSYKEDHYIKNNIIF